VSEPEYYRASCTACMEEIERWDRIWVTGRGDPFCAQCAFALGRELNSHHRGRLRVEYPACRACGRPRVDLPPLKPKAEVES
jgi:hypothetical protein